MFHYPVDEYGEEIHRLFDSDLSPMHRRVPAPQLITYNNVKQISQLQIQNPHTKAIELDTHTAVIRIDGACRDNGKPTARASWGVFVGPGSRYNACGRLEADLPQTSSRAEIEALSHALDAVRNITKNDYSLSEVKIASDSEYLVNAMSRWIEGWIEGGGLGSRRRPVAHFGKLKAIHEKLDEMEYGDDGGIHVQFWHVPREKNQEADALANEALDA
jgi:ribonuclease HI